MGTTQDSEKITEHPAWQRLEDQLCWYDKKSVYCQRWHKGLNIFKVVLAVAIPVMCFIPADYSSLLMAFAGAVIAIFESLQQIGQYSTLWVTYRSTAECLKHEKFLFRSSAGPYRDLSKSEKFIQLAERVEEHVSSEHANWFNETKRITAGKN